jgi:hypothetical protein
MVDTAVLDNEWDIGVKYSVLNLFFFLYVKYINIKISITHIQNGVII